MNLDHEAVRTLIELVIMPVVVAIARCVIKLVNKKAEEVEARTQNETAKRLIDSAEKEVEKVVNSVTQSYVSSLKKAGTFDMESQAKAAEMAFETAIHIISIDAKKAIDEHHNDFTKWLETTIENCVLKGKK